MTKALKVLNEMLKEQETQARHAPETAQRIKAHEAAEILRQAIERIEAAR